MKLTLVVLPLTLAGALLSGCGGAYGGGDIGYGYGYGGGYAGPVAMGDCGGFYDGAYGAINDGCWGNDGAFWYQGGDHNWHRDDGGHFNHQALNGAQPFRGRGPGAGRPFPGGPRAGMDRQDHGGGPPSQDNRPHP